MPRSTYKLYESHFAYFATCSTVSWLPILNLPEISTIISDSRQFMQTNNKVKLYAYVIMPNHMHLVLQSDKLAKNLRAFKSYTARKTIDYLKDSRQEFFLNQLHALKKPYHKESIYQVWQEGYHPKQISDFEMMRQKIAYIHNNPVKAGYVKNPKDWKYSSAKNYYGDNALIPITTNW